MKYLLYVKYNLSGLVVYEVETDDIFHVMGRAMYCADEKIDRFTFVEDTQFRREFWASENKKIRECPFTWKM